MKCPHDDIKFCPLYVASHMANGHGCDDGDLDRGDCAITRGFSYARALARLKAAEPRLVAELAFQEDAEARDAQRRRNMRLLGIH